MKTTIEVKKVYLIYNPLSGNKRSQSILDKILPIFEKGHIETQIIETQYAGHARELANYLPSMVSTGFALLAATVQ